MTLEIRIKQKTNWFERKILGKPPYKSFWIESEEDIRIKKYIAGYGYVDVPLSLWNKEKL